MSEFRPIVSIVLTIVLVLSLIGVVQILKKGIYEAGDNIYFIGGGESSGVFSGDTGQVACVMEYAKKNSVDNRKCGCDDKSCSDYAMWITQYTKEYKVLDPILVVSVMMQESHCNHYQNGVVKGSSAGAVGLMQVMPDTGKGSCSYNLQDLYDEEKNIKCGVRVLRSKYENSRSNGDWKRALGLYYGSIGASYKNEVWNRYEKLKKIADDKC